MPDEPTPTPEPVMNLAHLEQAVTGLITTTVVLLKAFDIWNPSEEQLIAMLAAAGAYLAVLAPIIRFRRIRARVMPVEKVAAVKPEYTPTEATAGPAIWKPNPERLAP